MSCQPTLLQSFFETLLLSTVLNIRGFGCSHLIKDNILSEKTNKKISFFLKGKKTKRTERRWLIHKL